ncbi:MAG: 6-bladed beta-propeller [Melioribacteraceae bacterium]|nr:6-bladed beta-propeller [Melioribacteraceae bacterium]
MDEDENIFVVEKNSIHKFNREGKEISYLSLKGDGPGEFGRLGKIILDKNENIYLEDVKNQRILKYRKDFVYIMEFKKKHVTPITKWVIVYDSLLCTYSFLEPDEIIGIYDIKENIFLRNFGKNSELFIKYKETIQGGDLNTYNGDLYYINNLEYDIMKVDLNGNITKIDNETPNHFSSIQKSNDNPNPFHVPFSVVLNLFIVDDQFYVFSFPPSINDKLSKPVYDIVSPDGKIIKENLHSMYLPESKQITSTKFLKVVDQRNIYSSDSEKSKIIVRIMEINQ